MSLNIKYNASGTITVECGEEAVEIHPVRVKSPTIGVPVTPPILVGPQPASTPRKPPKIGPRVAIRIPEWLPLTEDVDPLVFDSAIQLEEFISPNPLFTWSTESIEDCGINVKIEPNQSVEVKTLMDKMQETDSDDLTLWMMPDLNIDK